MSEEQTISIFEVVDAATEAVGVDLVHIPSFAAQLTVDGTRFGAVFHDIEWEYCNARGHNDPLQRDASLAARWAAKEACVKAWSGLLLGRPPVLAEEGFPWHQIVVAHDEWRRPYLRFSGEIARALSELERDLNVRLRWNLSMSHDGDSAIAYVHVRAIPRTATPSL